MNSLLHIEKVVKCTLLMRSSGHLQTALMQSSGSLNATKGPFANYIVYERFFILRSDNIHSAAIEIDSIRKPKYRELEPVGSSSYANWRANLSGTMQIIREA